VGIDKIISVLTLIVNTVVTVSKTLENGSMNAVPAAKIKGHIPRLRLGNVRNLFTS
jgi:hypothetical protein